MELLLCTITYPKMRAIGFIEFFKSPYKNVVSRKNAFKVFISDFLYKIYTYTNHLCLVHRVNL